MGSGHSNGHPNPAATVSAPDYRCPTDGARQTSSSSFSTEPCGSGSGRNRRTSRRQISNSRNRARKAASNADADGIAISVQQLPQYGTRRPVAARPSPHYRASLAGWARKGRGTFREHAAWAPHKSFTLGTCSKLPGEDAALKEGHRGSADQAGRPPSASIALKRKLARSLGF